MDWSQLLSDRRFTGSLTGKAPAGESESISVFQKDAERILYSTAFRRLQGKTQVHPFPIFDYLRTRLTHTVEVAHVGRVIATDAAKVLQRKHSEINPIDCGDIVYSACLAHDLGNPPFGHVGEYAIQSWFEERSETDSCVKEVLDDPSQRNDFLHFDGNAQGFRIVTRLTGWRDRGGLQLSNAAIGAFSKYPYASIHSRDDKKKFGFMHEDRGYAEQVYEALGLIKRDDGRYCRHPLAFIVEAADDICYLTTDVEDAFRMNHISFTTATNILEKICRKGGKMGRYEQLNEHEEQDQIAYLRSGAISALMEAAVENFVQQADEMLKGNFSGSLVETPEFTGYIAEIRDLCRKKIYTERRKVETEAAGIDVVMTLMNNFGSMISKLKTSGESKLNVKEAHYFNLFPDYTRGKLLSATPYQCYLYLTDYVSGMTDRYALDLYSKITGVSPSIGKMG